MDRIKVARIRPITWMVAVQGEQEAETVRKLLEETGFETTDCEQQPDQVDPPVFAFKATSPAETPLVAPELEAILSADERIELAFESEEE